MNKQARTRTEELRKAQQEAARRQAQRRKVITIVSGVVILALVAAIVWAVVRAAGGDDSTASVSGGEVVSPANVTEDDTIPVGQDDAPVTVDIYYDYMCPVCGAFEEANSEELRRLVEDGTARLELHPMSFLDRMSSGTEYSTRSANAIATVADGAPESVWAFHGALYENQPEEGSSGLSDEEIADVAEEAGVPADVVDRFTDRTYDGWVASVTKQAGDDGVNGTPTVWIDGENFDGDLFTPGVLTEAVESAAGEQ
jgi:protein-disulfide isomerase